MACLLYVYIIKRLASYLFIYLFICLFIYLFICLFIYLFIYLFVYLFIYLFICLFFSQSGISWKGIRVSDVNGESVLCTEVEV